MKLDDEAIARMKLSNLFLKIAIPLAIVLLWIVMPIFLLSK